MEDEVTSGATAQMVGGGALAFAGISLLISAFAGLLSFCCGLIGMVASILVALSTLVSVGALGFGIFTARSEDLSEEQAGKAKMGAGFGLVAIVLNVVSFAFTCGPTLITLFLSLISQFL